MQHTEVNLIAVLSKPLHINSVELRNFLVDFHPIFVDITIEKYYAEEDRLLLMLEMKWRKNLIRIFQVDSPLPDSVLQNCLAQAQYSTELKHQFITHESHLMMSYLTSELSVREQYVMLAAIIWALSSKGAVGIINEDALSSFPLVPMPPNSEMDRLEMIRTLPLPLLFCGLITFQLEGTEIIWSRTLGAKKFGVPNIAVNLNGNDINAFDLFSELLAYSIDTPKVFHIGDTVEYGSYKFLVRGPYADEYYFIDDNEQVIILEILSKFIPG